MSTINSKVDHSKYFTSSPGGDTRPKGFWGGSFTGNASKEKNTGKFIDKNPGLRETRNDVKKHDCPFCG